MESNDTSSVLEVRFRATEDAWPSARDDRAAAEKLVAQMTLEEKLALVTAGVGYGASPEPGAIGSAAHNPGVPRLGIPAWDESDASTGVTNPQMARGQVDATAFPSGMALGATFDRELAEREGAALGVESKTAGMTFQLAGGMNLVREPRAGRNFEYIGEDVLHTGIMAGAAVKGVQSQGVASTVKHFAINPQETGRVMVSSDLAEAELRESDLLAFEIAIEHAGPRAVMTGYNMVNRLYAGENPWLLNLVLKSDWGYPGFVMSDWGATHSTVHAALAGLDRESGQQLDTEVYFGDLLGDAVRSGRVPESRLDDMVTRILTALHSVGATQGERRTPTALAQEVLDEHAALAARVATESIVLVRNENDVLPLDEKLPRLVVVGGRADTGVLSGGGSSAVTPLDAVVEEGFTIAQLSISRILHKPAPVDELRRALPHTEIVFLEGSAEDVAAQLRDDDVAVVVAQRWSAEGRDTDDLTLGAGQDELISAVAARAERTIVVLETPAAVLMPWLEEVDAVLAAWYGGAGGGPAIAAVLTGQVSPSGRLPVTFPATEAQLPRTSMTDPDSTTNNPGEPRLGGFPRIDYDIEGADVGYRWYQREHLSPAFWFGHGLSYTSFEYSDIAIDVDAEGNPVVSLTVTNTGGQTGADVPQMYVAPPKGTYRLVGWARVELEPGESRQVRLVADDPRCYATYVVDDPRWEVAEGAYRVRLARSADPADAVAQQAVTLAQRVLQP